VRAFGYGGGASVVHTRWSTTVWAFSGQTGQIDGGDWSDRYTPGSSEDDQAKPSRDWKLEP
jgi:hypothetical protein